MAESHSRVRSWGTIAHFLDHRPHRRGRCRRGFSLWDSSSSPVGAVFIVQAIFRLEANTRPLRRSGSHPRIDSPVGRAPPRRKRGGGASWCPWAPRHQCPSGERSQDRSSPRPQTGLFPGSSRSGLAGAERADSNPRPSGYALRTGNGGVAFACCLDGAGDVRPRGRLRPAAS